MKVVVGVGGGIAAYKSVHLVRELQRGGAEVRVVMTPSATRFVGAITFTGITGHPAVHDLWDPAYPGEVHVELAGWADQMVIAPATMNLIARATAGFADDVVLATWACMRGQRWLAPAMHSAMWDASATRQNISTLQARGVRIIGPTDGPLASGETGIGRMEEPEIIAKEILSGKRDLHGLKLLISAGPTQEAVDPVRFLSNHSTGKMGYALASAAARRGAAVQLVSGPTKLACPANVDRTSVQSAREMHAAIMDLAPNSDAIVMTAAVADYRPANPSPSKHKKGEAPLTLELIRNPDILAELGASRSGPSPFLVGFALETEDLEINARKKLESKAVDLVVANEASVGFGGDSTRVTLVSAAESLALPTMSKAAVADRILDHILEQREPNS